MMRIKDGCVKAVGRETWRPSVGYHVGESQACVSDFWRCKEELGNLENKGEVTGGVLNLWEE